MIVRDAFDSCSGYEMSDLRLRAARARVAELGGIAPSDPARLASATARAAPHTGFAAPHIGFAAPHTGFARPPAR